MNEKNNDKDSEKQEKISIESEEFQKIKIAHQYILSRKREQMENIEFIQSKFNWILVANVLIFGFIINEKNIYFLDIFSILSSLFVLISFCFIFSSLILREYKMGPKLSSLIKYTKSEKYNLSRYIDEINKNLAKSINDGSVKIKVFSKNLKYSIIFTGLSLIFLFFLNIC